MGAVRAIVKLTNGSDEALIRTGQLRPEDIRVYETEALVVTGSIETVIPAAVMKQLGLFSVERISVRYADGRTEVVDKAGPLMVHLLGRRANGDALVLGDEVLIGQVTLESMDLHVDCANQRLIPNPKYPDRPTFRV